VLRRTSWSKDEVSMVKAEEKSLDIPIFINCRLLGGGKSRQLGFQKPPFIIFSKKIPMTLSE
jgi:hypothetical protein